MATLGLRTGTLLMLGLRRRAAGSLGIGRRRRVLRLRVGLHLLVRRKLRMRLDLRPWLDRLLGWDLWGTTAGLSPGAAARCR